MDFMPFFVCLFLMVAVCAWSLWEIVGLRPLPPVRVPSLEDEAIMEAHRKEYVATPDDSRFPTFERDGWRLTDAALEASQSCGVFKIPSLIQKSGVASGQVVDLFFDYPLDEYGGFISVKIDSRLGDIFSGTVLPDEEEDLRIGNAQIWFH